jgi:hypothetical protein
MGRWKPDLLFWILAPLSGACVVAITWLDADCSFEGSFHPLRWILALGYVLFARPLLMTKPGRAVLGAGLLWMLVILPQVRWNHVKSFYVDARRLELGIGEAEVRESMAAHFEVGRTDQPTAEEQEWCVPSHPCEEMLFIHSPEDWADRCEVELDRQGRVRAIHIEKN